MRTRLPLALGLLLVSPAYAFNEPTDFRGISWGTSMEQAQQILLKNWEPSTQPGGGPECVPAKGFCRQRTTLGPVKVVFTYVFKADKFVTALVAFKPDDYVTVRRIFDEKYGQPTDRQIETIRTKMGVPYENERSFWKGATASILLRRFAGRIDEGRAMVSLNASVDEGTAEREQAIKKGKDDL